MSSSSFYCYCRAVEEFKFEGHGLSVKIFDEIYNIEDVFYNLAIDMYDNNAGSIRIRVT